MPVARRETHCPICGPAAGYRVRYPENLAEDDLDFAARRAPKCIRYRIVECDRCGLVYSNPTYPAETIASLYRDNPFHKDEQIKSYCSEYLRYFDKAAAIVGKPSSVLEIGCANGYFLRALKAKGIERVAGVEPSRNAADQADPGIRDDIVVDWFTAELFEPDIFDVVCAFQVMDHLVDPAAVSQSIARVLRPGGIFLAINHNIRSWAPELLGRRCAMYDVQHTFLFDLRTMPMLMENAGLECVFARGITNQYSLAYAAKMLPVLPLGVRTKLIDALRKIGVAESRVRVPGGNMAVMGQKRAGS